jgi:hypothetical protein
VTDERLRRLQRRALTGDLEARRQLFFEARRLGSFGYEGREFESTLMLLAYLGDRQAREILRGRGYRRWKPLRIRSGAFGMGGSIAIAAGLAAARFVLPHWESEEATLFMYPGELSWPAQAIAFVQNNLDTYLDHPRFKSYGGRKHSRYTWVPSYVDRNSYEFLYEQGVSLLTELGFEQSWLAGWESVRIPGTHSNKQLAADWAAATAHALLMAHAEREYPSVQHGILNTIERAELSEAEYMTHLVARGGTPVHLSHPALRKGSAPKLREAMRKELVPFLTDDLVPA